MLKEEPEAIRDLLRRASKVLAMLAESSLLDAILDEDPTESPCRETPHSDVLNPKPRKSSKSRPRPRPKPVTLNGSDAAAMLSIGLSKFNALSHENVFTLIADPRGRKSGRRIFYHTDELEIYGETRNPERVREFRREIGRLKREFPPSADVCTWREPPST
ncbi:hypothetical protein [Zavarzinella formosa]|uniref:hypothetical protein n=1 Tax=Zavarzinella formosa TaxID=360055 RepID=UPI000318CBAD|nr:hypothetical protein [Zavarzinella formosa]